MTSGRDDQIHDVADSWSTVSKELVILSKKIDAKFIIHEYIPSLELLQHNCLTIVSLVPVTTHVSCPNLATERNNKYINNIKFRINFITATND